MKKSLQLAEQIMDVLHDGVIMNQHFPMLVTRGISDIGVTVHSHFLTFLATVGQYLGFAAVSECPITWSGEYSSLGNVRADSIWFDRESLMPTAVFEFERFERGDETKLRQKVQNLVIASLATPSLKIASLVYWVKSGSIPHSMDSVVASYRNGFRRNGQQVPGSKVPLIIIKCVLRATECNGLLFGEFLRDELNERLVLGGI